jgi:hypothetical protein
MMANTLDDYDDLLTFLATFYPDRPFDEEMLIDEFSQGDTAKSFHVVDMIEELETKNFIKRYYQENDGIGEDERMIELTPEGSMFLALGGFTKEKEIHDNNLEMLKLATQSSADTAASLRINKEIKPYVVVGTIAAVIAAIVGIIALCQ